MSVNPQLTTGNIWCYTSSSAPVAADSDYPVPTLWVIPDGSTYEITDNTAGAAVWKKITITSPVASSSATSTFGAISLGTAKQNTVGHDIHVNFSITVTAATGAKIQMGVGSTSTPTKNDLTASFTLAAVTILNFSAVVPINYYLLVDTTGTITVSSVTTQVCPL